MANAGEKLLTKQTPGLFHHEMYTEADELLIPQPYEMYIAPQYIWLHQTWGLHFKVGLGHSIFHKEYGVNYKAILWNKQGFSIE